MFPYLYFRKHPLSCPFIEKKDGTKCIIYKYRQSLPYAIYSNLFFLPLFKYLPKIYKMYIQINCFIKKVTRLLIKKRYEFLI